MFQSFDDPPTALNAAGRLARLREVLRGRKLSGFLVPKTDEFQNEYVPPHSDRLAWLTGFTGSAGTAIVLDEKAALLVDSRYTLQAREQVSREQFSIEDFPAVTVESYLEANAGPGSVIGYDPRLHSVESVRKLEKASKQCGFILQQVEENPIDELWEERPAARSSPAFRHGPEYSGEDAASKLKRIGRKIAEKRCDAALIAAPESVCWLFNLRGSDIEHTPLVMARAVLPVEGKAWLFIGEDKLSDQLRSELETLARIFPLEEFANRIGEAAPRGQRVLIDPALTPQYFATRLQSAGAEIVEAPDPAIFAKAVKNETELNGARAAHQRDGAALCRFLAWLDRTAPSGGLDEITAAEKLEDFRRETNALKDISFDTISAAGPHGAIVHYRVTRRSNAPLLPGTLYLVDSGGQYLDGTTDVTRTVAIGDPTPEMRRHFTLVLKAHIALATARFPKGTRGVDLDGIARNPLWRAGLDYGHGTGHGIGSYLSVHEGPQSISKRGMTALEPGMILSIEPGLYIEGEYGIRLENLAAVTAPEEIEGGSLPMMGFETLTLAPFDRRLIDIALLTHDERAWLNAYHMQVWSEIAPKLSPAEQAWLACATAPI